MKNKKILFIIAIFFINFFILITNIGMAKDGKKKDSPFVSLKFNEVNVRAGPNIDFPLIITYRSQFLPVKIIGEYDNWLKIVDKDRDGGWIKSYLITRTLKSVVVLQEQLLYSNYNQESYPIYRVEKNVVLTLKKCKKNRCKVQYGKKVSGWIDKDSVWGLDE